MNFRLLKVSPDIASLVSALERQPEIWALDTFWKDHPIPIFREVDTIYLRFPDKEVFRSGVGDVNTCEDQKAISLLPESREVIWAIFEHVRGKELGRVLINRLPPCAKVLPHSDGENLYYSRYHVVLQTNDLIEFRCGQEYASMREGEVWWFDNSVEHEVINHGDTPRIHLIVDIRT